MRRSFHLVFVVSLSLVFSIVSLMAHHSAGAAYDTSKKITLTGTVTRLEWKNPHIFYFIDVMDLNGTVTNWAVEGSTPNQLYRAGWRKADLNVGDKVTLINSSPARNGSPKTYGGTLTLASGRQVFSGSAADDR
jgi:hypothetical protein